jgi:predicted DNA-binding protein (UPF0251 family)
MCHGLGRSEKRGATCPCVYRHIANACLDRYRELIESEAQGRDCFMELSKGHIMATMRTSEFLADFEMAARRVLDATEAKVFRLYLVEGLTWQQCAFRLQLEHCSFYQAVQRTILTLGRELARSEIWPLDAYFGAQRIRSQEPKAVGAGPEVPYYHRSALAAT